MSDNEENSFDIKLNEYYKLKSEYDNSIDKIRAQIRNSKSLSKQQKIDDFKKIKPKCINCKRIGGTLFSQKEMDNKRIVSAICNISNNPCNLDIKLSLGVFYLLPNILNEIEDEVKIIKNKIIDYKNKQLYNFISSEEAIVIFDDLKSELNDNLSIIDEHNTLLLNKTENVFNNEEYKKEFELLQTYILQLKGCIKKFDDSNNIQFIIDAVNIYIDNINTTNYNIINLKYKENIVYFDSSDATYHLIQNQNKISDLEIDVSEQKIISFIYGNVKYNKNITLDENKSKPFVLSKKNGEIIWNNNSYEKIWNNLPKKTKDVLIKDKEWMMLFLQACFKNRKENKPCEFINPPNLIVPPNKEVVDGVTKYEFGNLDYDNMFNNLSKTHQNTLLTLHTTKNGKINYNMLKEALSKQMSVDLQFNNWNIKYAPI
jgi:hypothetical protein